MYGLSTLLNRFLLHRTGKHRLFEFPFTSYIKTDITHSDLLDRETITDLRARALQLLNSQYDPVLNNRLVQQRQHGEYRSTWHGSGLDFEDNRRYLPGDDLRNMNWRLTARSNDAHVKVFREERQPEAFILFDRRSSMRFGTRARLKVTQALRVVILLAFYQLYRGCHVRGVILDKPLRWLESTTDEHGVLAMMELLNQACPPMHAQAQSVSMAQTLRMMDDVLNPGAVVYLVSDFSDTTTDCCPPLAALAAKHSLTSIHVVDPAEINLPSAGELRLSDISAEKSQVIDTSDKIIVTQYHQMAQEYLTQRETMLRSLGLRYCRLLSTTDSIETTIMMS